MGADQPQPMIAIPPLSAPARLWVRALWYCGSALVALLVILGGVRLDLVSVWMPLQYDEDALLILPMVQATLEGGTHWHTDRLGAPGIQQMHDFPVIDHLHFALIWLLGQFFPHAALVYNLYYLLTYPLAALTAMAALRHFGLSFPASASAGVLFAVQPYHYYRGENHYFLAAYYMIPITLMVTIWLMRGRYPFFQSATHPSRAGRFTLWSRESIFVVAVCLATASAGAYYAFFACALLVAAGVYGTIAGRSWRAMVSMLLLLALIVLGGIVNHLPTFIYQAKHGQHSAPTQRFPVDAEYYGLKISQLLLPIDNHSLRSMHNLKSMYNSYDRPVQSVSERYSLGTIGALGFCLLFVRLLLPLPRRWPYTELAALTVFAVLVGTVGGLGSIFNLTVTPQVRCYNRIAIYIAFLCLFAIFQAFDEAATTLARHWVHRPRLRCVVLAIGWITLTCFGIWDQTPYDWGGPPTVERIEKHQRWYQEDAKFYSEVESILNPDGTTPGPMVFQLPYVQWPESPPTQQLAAYEHARGYLHTRTLRWGFGTMRGRELDEWYKRVAILPIEQMLERVVAAGFEGLILDKRGYTPSRADLIQRQLGQVLGSVRQVVYPGGMIVFFDLQKHRNWLRDHYGPAGWDAMMRNEFARPTIMWMNGFVSFKEPGYEWSLRWCGPKGTAFFQNPTDQPRTYRVQFQIRTNLRDPAELQIRGGELWTEDLTIDKSSPTIEREFTIPPGRHRVDFFCTPPVTFVPNESRRLMFYISGLKLD